VTNPAFAIKSGLRGNEDGHADSVGEVWTATRAGRDLPSPELGEESLFARALSQLGQAPQTRSDHRRLPHPQKLDARAR
jgi:hypothetical protein